MIIVTGEIFCKPEALADFGQALAAAGAATRLEDGCVSYDVVLADADKCRFVAIEKWADEAALKAHMTSPHMTTLFAEHGPLVTAMNLSVYDAVNERPLM